MIKVIKEGDKSKQGNARCPQCGEIVLIVSHYGDYPRCPHCNVAYQPILRPTKYE